jgi:threonine synthase
MATEKYEVKPSVVTISNAMDVGNPSNFVRILEMMQNNFTTLSNALSSYSITDADTKATIARVYKTNNYILDPHGAVAFIAAEQFLSEQLNNKTNTTTEDAFSAGAIILETAHPVKFSEVVEEAIGQSLSIPASVQNLFEREKVSIPLAPNYTAFKNWMLNK